MPGFPGTEGIEESFGNSEVAGISCTSLASLLSSYTFPNISEPPKLRFRLLAYKSIQLEPVFIESCSIYLLVRHSLSSDPVSVIRQGPNYQLFIRRNLFPIPFKISGYSAYSRVLVLSTAIHLNIF